MQFPLNYIYIIYTCWFYISCKCQVSLYNKHLPRCYVYIASISNDQLLPEKFEMKDLIDFHEKLEIKDLRLGY